MTKKVKQIVREQGLDLVGIASTARLDELTPAGCRALGARAKITSQSSRSDLGQLWLT